MLLATAADRYPSHLLMAATAGLDTKLQIGHVLFMDIVGYSKLLVDEQTTAVRRLSEIVQATDEFKTSGRKNKLIRIPTGDGMALVFRDSPESPVRCALAISQALRRENVPLPVRMGIHSGLVHGVADVNNRLNVAGAGINIAQRVMDCGDDGHILLSKHVAEDLEHHARWRPLLHDLGSCEVKHGIKVGVVNLFDSTTGNPELPLTIRRQRKKSRTGNAFLISGTLILGLFTALATWFISTRYSDTRPQVAAASASPASLTPDRSPNSVPSAVTFAPLTAGSVNFSGPAVAQEFSPASPIDDPNVFAGKWRGTIRSTGPRGTNTSQIEFTIDATGNQWSNYGRGTVSRRGRTLTYTRSYRLGRTNVYQTADLTLTNDGKSGTYRSTQTSTTGKIRSTSSGFGTVEKVE